MSDVTGRATSETPPAIEVRNLSKRFRLRRDRPASVKELFVRLRRSGAEDFWALRDVSLSIPRGSTFGLIGHNGSGKSTLLRTVAGIHRPTTGEVRVDGRVSALLELGAGFHPELTGRENVYLNGSILGLGRDQIGSKLDQIAEFAGLGDFLDEPVRFYSSGMHVRLGFSVAVHVDPDVLIVDEIIAVGDEEFQRRCFDHLYELRRRGTTMVLVSHAHTLVEQMCDDVAWLDHGRLVGVGNPGEMIHRYLDRVNEAESRRLEAGPDASRSETDGRGSGEIRVVDVEYLDESGKSVPAVVAGSPMRIRLHYRIREPVDAPVFGVIVHHENGAQLAGPNTHIAGVPVGRLATDGHVDYVIERLPLISGVYRLTTCIFDQHLLHPFDVRDMAFPLRVQPGAVGEQGGLIDLGGRWDAEWADRTRSDTR